MTTSAVYRLPLGSQGEAIAVAIQLDWQAGRPEPNVQHDSNGMAAIRTEDGQYAGYVGARDSWGRLFTEFRSIAKNGNRTWRIVYAMHAESGAPEYVGKLRRLTRWARAHGWR